MTEERQSYAEATKELLTLLGGCLIKALAEMAFMCALFLLFVGVVYAAAWIAAVVFLPFLLLLDWLVN